MTGPVPHYQCGEWRTPTDAGTPRRHAVHGEEAYRVTAVPVDTAPAVAYARAVGIPALHGLGFAGRARALVLLARHLGTYQAEFVALIRLGGAPADAERDVRAGIDSMRRQADSVTRRFAGETTNDGRLLVDPAHHAASGSPSALLAAAPPGIAVHITGFADPVTTMLDAFASALLTGMPVIVRPSRRTAELTAHLVRRISECASLPPGCLQLVTGPTDPTHHLGPHDLVRFTGTAATARRLRTRLASMPAPPRAEFAAGVLDCAVLGPDVAAGGPAFRLFVDRLAAGMSTHNGQTRRAVRRAFVPAALRDAVGEAASEALRALRLGDPAHADGVLGPLVDAAHRRRVLSALAQLRASARTMCGTPKEIVVAADEFGPGAYMPPVLLAADEPYARDLHRVEAFGPVATLIPYRTTDDIAAALTLGGSGLRSWIVTEDPGHARELARAMAPTHEHVHLLNPEPAHPAEPPPAPDATDRIRTRLTATTVSGTPAHLTAATDRWTPGAPHPTRGTNPLSLYLSDLRLGDTVTAGPRTVTREDIAAFAELTGDHYYLHTDEAAAARHPLYRGIVAHGHLVAAVATGMLVPPEPGPVLANLGLDNLRFLAPVRPGDPLTVTMTATRITAHPRAGRGEVRWHVTVAGRGDRPVARFDLTTLTADRPASD
ncbi:aldehyde dehydrogenase family protein [Yinghuangia seranimata]|uniref:aldehyde dehydrogenase family protein n=1 Tax=Yinghuangia seranimata TaxID=408067 RepID=UPI00248AC03F|nr:aldehyde dehydrogenase family protein [Yinghuangia seranimata]MDI2125655.1 aldehyde dehydrogenase family protein [Yinghuangia seranimata]